MKKLTALFSFIFIFSITGFSQDRYIEVLVKDTLLVEPQRWTLFINIEKQYDYAMVDSTVAYPTDTISAPTNYGQDFPKPKEGTSPDLIKSLAKKFKGTVIEEANSLYNFNQGKYDNAEGESNFKVEFTSRKAMEDFMKAASEYKDVKSMIIDTHHSDLERYQGQLESKLMQAAKQKATRLAQLSGRKAGMVILVSEATQSENNTIQELIEMVMKYEGSIGRRMAFMNFFPDKIKLEKMLKVRFAME